MTEVAIHVWLHPDDPRAGTLRAAEWQGALNWPSAPIVGSEWQCCVDGEVNVIDRVTFGGPGAGPALTVEVNAEASALRHLVDAHGFTATIAG